MVTFPVFPADRRGFGIYGMSTVLPALGPTVGGITIDALSDTSFRAFALIMIALALGLVFMPSARSKGQKFDWLAIF